MREIHTELIRKKIAELCARVNVELPQDVYDALKNAIKEEHHQRAKKVLEMILKNADYARQTGLPMCQDTGYVVCFIDVGQNVRFSSGSIEDAVQEGIRSGYKNLRKSIVSDPIERKNTNDNTPGIVHYRIVPGDKVRIFILPKGGGAENVGAFTVLKPTAHKDEIKKFVVDSILKAGGKPCPPIIVGVGIGGLSEKTFEIAKRALLRKVGQKSSKRKWAEFERELKTAINNTNIGPAGLGGKTTCLAVHIETFPCHIASLPIAVNIQCHAARHGEAVI